MVGGRLGVLLTACGPLTDASALVNLFVLALFGSLGTQSEEGRKIVIF